MENKMNRIGDFKNFSEAMRTKDLSSIPGKIPGDEDYIAKVTDRAKTRLGIERAREGDAGMAIGPLMQELSRSTSLSLGYEKELSQLAEEVIIGLYKPIIDAYNIKLDIAIDSGNGIRRMIDNAFAEQKPLEPNPKLSPTVKARGVDFSMLIHEAVKGIWEVMSLGSIPKDPALAQAIESQFGLRDEPDEWKYGPEIAADLRDFVNQNPKTDQYKNVREELWKYMVNPINLPTDEFLLLMKGILSNTEEARIKVDLIIDKLVIDIEKRDRYARDLAKYNFEMAEYERKMEEWNRRNKAADQFKAPSINIKKDAEIEGDYSQMSQKRLSDELSQALDARDFDKVKIISQYIK
jgi:hypothetical protein